MNAIKAMGEQLGNAVKAMEEDSNIDQRWVAIAKTHFQQGLMALTRSVAKPTFF